MVIVKYTNAIDRLPDQAGINNVLAERTWAEMRVLGLCKTEIDYMTYRGMLPEYVSAGHMVAKITFRPNSLPQLCHSPLAIYTKKLLHP